MVINWLIIDSCSNFFDETGVYEKELDAARELIYKFSRICSYTTFEKLENAIYCYREKNELYIAKERFDHNRQVRAGDYSGGCFIADWPYWGKVHVNVNIKM